ncbi:UNVERIFIED_CONTAM: drug/metabolite transporter (DMT)-like permease [Brevibacillus sp. OAP136]
MRTQAKADGMLVIVTLFWGSSYLFMKMGLTALQEFNLIALRFGIAFLLAGLIFYRRMLRSDWKTIRSALVLGVILFGVFASVTFGVKMTTTANAGFLVSLTVIIVPIISSIVGRKIPEGKVIVGVILAIAGIGLMTITSSLAIRMGDMLCIVTAFCYALHILTTGALTKQVDSIALGVWQLGVTAAIALVFSFCVETPQLPSTPASWTAVMALSILCSGVGFIVQTTAQKFTTPTHTGLIFSLEPIFAALFAILFLDETLTLRSYVGAATVLAGVLLAELDWAKMLRKRKRGTSVECG